MCALPEIRAALKRGTITLTKALLLAKDANRSDVEARVADAATTTCQQVERESTEKEDRKNRALRTLLIWGLGSVNGCPVEVWVTRGDDDVRADSAATTGVKSRPPGWG